MTSNSTTRKNIDKTNMLFKSKSLTLSEALKAGPIIFLRPVISANFHQLLGDFSAAKQWNTTFLWQNCTKHVFSTWKKKHRVESSEVRMLRKYASNLRLRADMMVAMGHSAGEDGRHRIHNLMTYIIHHPTSHKLSGRSTLSCALNEFDVTFHPPRMGVKQKTQSDTADTAGLIQAGTWCPCWRQRMTPWMEIWGENWCSPSFRWFQHLKAEKRPTTKTAPQQRILPTFFFQEWPFCSSFWTVFNIFGFQKRLKATGNLRHVAPEISCRPAGLICFAAAFQGPRGKGAETAFCCEVVGAFLPGFRVKITVKHWWNHSWVLLKPCIHMC